MKRFLATIPLRCGARILDVGGLPDLWNMIEVDAEITLLNLPGAIGADQPHAGYRIIEGDICHLPDLPRRFDVVFSNSVLEHVGSARRQRLFVQAVTSAPAYWVQVPARWFPIEAHCGVLFWWALPRRWRRRRMMRWWRGGKRWYGRQMAGTRPFDRHRLRSLFPFARIGREWAFLFVKSYYISSPPQQGR